jgi:hypothetical protein
MLEAAYDVTRASELAMPFGRPSLTRAGRAGAAHCDAGAPTFPDPRLRNFDLPPGDPDGDTQIQSQYRDLPFWLHLGGGDHELSIRVGTVGRYRGAQPRSKVSTMIMRPPQQGQGCESVCSSLSPRSLKGTCS